MGILYEVKTEKMLLQSEKRLLNTTKTSQQLIATLTDQRRDLKREIQNYLVSRGVQNMAQMGTSDRTSVLWEELWLLFSHIPTNHKSNMQLLRNRETSCLGT